MTSSSLVSKYATLCFKSDTSSLTGLGFKLAGTYLLELSEEEETAD